MPIVTTFFLFNSVKITCQMFLSLQRLNLSFGFKYFIFLYKYVIIHTVVIFRKASWCWEFFACNSFQPSHIWAVICNIDVVVASVIYIYFQPYFSIINLIQCMKTMHTISLWKPWLVNILTDSGCPVEV